jgi:hypothetical protein
MRIKLIVLLLLSTSANGDEIYAQDGTYLGKLGGSSSQYESTANPNGPYGSTWGVNSITAMVLHGPLSLPITLIPLRPL